MKFCPFWEKQNYTKKYKCKPDQYHRKLTYNTISDNANISLKQFNYKNVTAEVWPTLFPNLSTLNNPR